MEDSEDNTIKYIKPSLSDASAIHRLVASCPPLDLNSLYCYVLLCDHYSDYCLKAVLGGSLVGFISSYPHPKKDNTIFIWQVAVVRDFRKRGIARSLVKTLLEDTLRKGFKALETTITPSNKASQTLFKRLAEEMGGTYSRAEHYSRDLLGGEHEEELLIRIEFDN